MFNLNNEHKTQIKNDITKKFIDNFNNLDDYQKFLIIRDGIFDVLNREKGVKNTLDYGPDINAIVKRINAKVANVKDIIEKEVDNSFNNIDCEVKTKYNWRAKLAVIVALLPQCIDDISDKIDISEVDSFCNNMLKIEINMAIHDYISKSQI